MHSDCDFEARGMTLRPLPPRLYKFRSFNVNSLRLLTQAEIYYSNPRGFNDPLDCNPTIKVDVNRTSLVRLCYKMLQKTGANKEKTTDIINDLRYMSTEDGDYVATTEIDFKERLADKIKGVLDAEMKGKGVFSLSERWDSPLMWSHYADEHRGFCLEYDTTQIPHTSIAAVDYRSPRCVKASDLIGWKFQGSSEAERRVHNTYFFAKSPQWQYEKEWRDIGQSIGIATTSFPITATYFGFRCDQAVMTSIVKLFSGEEEITFFQVYSLNDSFKLKRRQVDRGEVEACGLIRGSAALTFKDFVQSE